MIYSCMIWSTDGDGDASPFIIGHITKSPDKYKPEDLAELLVKNSAGYIDKDYRQEMREPIVSVEVVSVDTKEVPGIHHWTLEVKAVITAASGKKITPTLDFFIEKSEKLS